MVRPSIHSPANIESRVTRVTLPSGIKMVLMPKKNRGGTVTAQLELHFGDVASLSAKAAAAQMAGSLLGRGGPRSSVPASSARMR